jgi:hypothetical protein
MKPRFNKKLHYNERDVIDEIVRARLFDDFENLCASDDEESLRDAYKKVLTYYTVNTDKRLKIFSKKF